MVKSCCVPNCKTNAKSSSKRLFLYQVPKNKKQRYLWNKAIGRKDRDIKSNEYVCGKHFKNKEFSNFLKSGKDIGKSKKPQLSTNAIPSILPTSNNKTSTPPAMESSDSDCSLLPTVDSSADQESVLPNTEAQQKAQNPLNSRNADGLLINSEDESYSDTASEPEGDDFEVHIRKNIVKKTNKRLRNIESDSIVVHVIKSPIFISLWNGETKLKLPNKSWALHFLSQNNKSIVISEMAIDLNRLPKVLRQILLSEDLKLSYFIRNKRIDDEVVEHINLNTVVSCARDIQNSIKDLIDAKLCLGGASEIEYPTSVISTKLAVVDEQLHRWKHRNCEILTQNDEKCCKLCSTLEQYFCKVTEKPFILF